jgi:glycosyltransferase involved in cell wall biosynthesis
MKILLTADPELPVPPGLYGGIERIVEGLINSYVEQGHEVTLCANPASKVPCRLVPWKGRTSANPADTLRNCLTLTGLVLSGRYDVLHSFSRLAYMTAVMPMRIPKIMSYQREPSLSQVGKAVKLSRKGSMVFTGCSNYIASQIGGIADARAIWNFVPIDRYTLTPAVDADAPLVFLGRIEEIKGTAIAVEVARRTNRRLIIAGNIPAGKEDYFEKEIRPYLNERIVYVGAVNDEQKNALLGQAAAFLMPIQWNEPFGIVMIEAMACGTPVLGFPRGAVPEVVEEGKNGFLCNDAEEMVIKLQQLNTISRQEVRRITEAKFSDKKIVDEYLRLYRELTNRYDD